ncbi:MAG: hypothetical protein ACRDRH_14860 [Pseudonocardia sp.]
MTPMVDTCADSDRVAEIRNALVDKLRSDGMITTPQGVRAMTDHHEPATSDSGLSIVGFNPSPGLPEACRGRLFTTGRPSREDIS